MVKTSDPVALNDWQAVGNIDEIKSGKRRNTRLLGQDIIVEMDDERPRMFEANADGGLGQEHPAQIMYGYIWTTLGTPEKPPLSMPEFLEDGRRFIACGVVTVRASALRIVENFLDMSHFPYVHTGVLGEEPITEVTDYKSEIRQPDDEIWATDCNFFQPQAAMSADDGQISEYMYRVTSPFVTVLYKTCPVVDDAWDLVGIFVQPREEGVCDVHTFMLVFDDTSTYADLVHFQQKIFLQDRSILENQQPTGLPLSPKDEAAIRADGSSMLYRRWLRQKGLTFGTYQGDRATRAA
jgi:phenylpropionate dioxygenase-like ring-hydroxylating dioxygenase large terminal subunit